MSLPAEPRLLVFDLDGTLVDSQVDLSNSVNATLAHFGKPTLPQQVIAGYIGNGAETLIRRALAHAYVAADEPDPHDERFVQQAHLWFLGYYREHKLDFTYVYSGVVDALSSIRSLRPDLPMAVLTNKPVFPSRAICRHLGLEPFFFQNYGGNSFPTKKPDPEGFLRLMAEAEALTGFSIAPADTIMIGDSHVDVETAHACGAASLGCLYGLSPDTLQAAQPDALCEQASEWVRLIVRQASAS